MPNAQVVADRFHVMTQINKELDTQRKREKRKVEDLIKKANATEKLKFEEILAGLKNSKYPLLKNQDKLTQEQLDKLIQVKNVSPILKEMHEFKEKIRKKEKRKKREGKKREVMKRQECEGKKKKIKTKREGKNKDIKEEGSSVKSR